VIEALLAVAALAACVYAMAWTSRLQFRALELSQAGRLAAFSAARAPQAAADTDGTGRAMRVRLYLPARVQNLWQDEAHTRLAADWLRVDDTLLAADAFGQVVPSGGWDGAWHAASPLVLHRHTALAHRAGHGQSDMQVQQRLTQSRTGWADVAQPSLELSSTLRRRAAGVETAWGRREPGDDWVSAWADLIPPTYVQARKR